MAGLIGNAGKLIVACFAIVPATWLCYNIGTYYNTEYKISKGYWFSY